MFLEQGKFPRSWIPSMFLEQGNNLYRDKILTLLPPRNGNPLISSISLSHSVPFFPPIGNLPIYQGSPYNERAVTWVTASVYSIYCAKSLMSQQYLALASNQTNPMIIFLVVNTTGSRRRSITNTITFSYLC